jgi:hypothetical protein
MLPPYLLQLLMFISSILQQYSNRNKFTALPKDLLTSSLTNCLSAASVASGTQDHGFKPSRSHRIFQGEKILGVPSFGGEVKLSVPCHRSVACKRTLHLMWNSSNDGRICQLFLAHNSSFTNRGLPCCLAWSAYGDDWWNNKGGAQRACSL